MVASFNFMARARTLALPTLVTAVNLLGCGSDEVPSCDPVTDETCTLTIQPENIPSVSIAGQEVPVSKWSIDSFETYNGICPDGAEIFQYPAPSGPSTLSTSSSNMLLFDETWTAFPYALFYYTDEGEPRGHYTSISQQDHFFNFNQAVLSCSQWKTYGQDEAYPWDDFREDSMIQVLDPANTNSLTLSDNQILSIRDELRSQYGSEIDMGIPYINVGDNNVWLTFHDEGGTTFGMVEVDLVTGNFNTIWVDELTIAISRYIDDLRIQDGKLIVAIQAEGYQLAYLAVFDLTQKSFLSLIQLPDTPVHYNGSTVEGIPFADLEQDLKIRFTNSSLVGDELWIAHQARTDTATVVKQTSLVTLTRYDVLTGQKLEDIPLDIYDVRVLEAIEGTDLVAVAGKKDLYLNGDTIAGTSTVRFLDKTTGQVVEMQDFAGSLIFSNDGRRLVEGQQNYYEFDDGALQYESIVSPEKEINVGPYRYSYQETPEQSLFEVAPRVLRPEDQLDAIAALNGHDDGKRLYAGINRDYLYVDIDANRAHYFSLPLAESCYHFFSAYDADGDPNHEDSCALETGAASVFGNKLYIGYGTQVFKIGLPSN